MGDSCGSLDDIVCVDLWNSIGKCGQVIRYNIIWVLEGVSRSFRRSKKRNWNQVSPSCCRAVSKLSKTKPQGSLRAYLKNGRITMSFPSISTTKNWEAPNKCQSQSAQSKNYPTLSFPSSIPSLLSFPCTSFPT